MDDSRPQASGEPDATAALCEGITVDVERCCVCRACELACSFHLTGAFDPSAAAISILYDAGTGTAQVGITEACDLCPREPTGPLCVDHCPIDGTIWRVLCG